MARPRRSRSIGSRLAPSAEPAASVPEAGLASACSPAEAAIREAVRFLARAARTTAEVERHLADRGVHPDVIGTTLHTLAARRYVDDDAVAERRAEELLLRRGQGRLKVTFEL